MTVLVACLAFSVLASLLSLGLFWVTRRLLSKERRARATNVASAYFNTIGTIYAVILGFMFSGVWSQFQDAGRCVDLEANSLAQMVRLVSTFPPEVQARLRSVVQAYGDAMIRFEWDAMQQGQESPQGVETYKRLTAIIAEMKPETPAQVNAHSELLSNFTDFMKFRRLRILRSNESFPTILWVVLWVGAVITIGFSCFFELEDPKLHAIKIVGLSVMVALVVFTIWEIYGPFEGLVTVPPDPFRSLLQHLAEGAI